MQTQDGYASGSIAFSYIIKVTGISPASGSMNGGTELTISGDNFSVSPTDNQVFIGDEFNQFCHITSATKTQIKCTTPPAHADYRSGDVQTVYVTGRLIEDATCTGTCSFTYSDAETPTCAQPAFTTVQSGSTYTLTGSGFSNPTFVLIGSEKIIATGA